MRAENELRADRQIALEAVKNDSEVLAFTSDDLRADLDVVIWAVREEGSTQGAEVFGIGLRLNALYDQGADSDLARDAAKSSLATDGEAVPVFVAEHIKPSAINGANTTEWEIIEHMISGAAIRVHVSGRFAVADVADAVVEKSERRPYWHLRVRALDAGWCQLDFFADYEHRGDGWLGVAYCLFSFDRACGDSQPAWPAVLSPPAVILNLLGLQGRSWPAVILNLLGLRCSLQNSVPLGPQLNLHRHAAYTWSKGQG